MRTRPWAAAWACCLLLLGGCGGKQTPPQDPAPVRVEATPAQPSPAAQTAAAAASATPTPGSPEAVTGVSACDEYLSQYQRCEKTLQPTIAAGGARTWKAEAAWVQYMRGTPEGAGLQQWCLDSLVSLRKLCGV